MNSETKILIKQLEQSKLEEVGKTINQNLLFVLSVTFSLHCYKTQDLCMSCVSMAHQLKLENNYKHEYLTKEDKACKETQLSLLQYEQVVSTVQMKNQEISQFRGNNQKFPLVGCFSGFANYCSQNCRNS